MGIVRDLYYARKMSAGLKLPAPTVALLIKRLRLAAAMGGGGVEKTVSGSPAHITDALAKAALSVLASIEPIQDLHGYDHQWPAGGGKNKVDIPTAVITHQTTIYSVELSAGKYTLSADCTNNTSINGYLSIRLSGVAKGTVTIASGDSNVRKSATFTLEESGTYDVVGSGASSGYDFTVSNVQLESGSTMTEFAPYANICPISGRTGVEVYHAKYPTGKHLVLSASDFTQDAATRVKTAEFIAVQPGTDYVFAFDLVDTLSGVKYDTSVETYNADGDKLRDVNSSNTNGCRSGQFTADSNEVKVKVDIHAKSLSDTITTADIVSFAFDAQSTSYDPAGKNLFNRLNCVFGSYLNSSGKPTSGSDPSCYSCPIPLDANKSYTFSGISSSVGNNNKRVCFYKADDSFISAQASAITNADVPYSVTFTPPANTAYCRLSLNTADTYVMLEEGATQTVYEPYNGNTYAVDWSAQAGTVYGGTVDVVTGELTVDRANIPSYNGETINEPWLSSMDAYAEGTTPTTGAQVVYTLATPLTYQLSAQEVQMLLGENYVWSSSGDTVSVTYYAEGNANTLQSLNILLGGNYSNPKTADDVSDKEALEIILGGNK